MSYIKLRLHDAKLALRLFFLRVSARYNRFVNKRVTEKLAKITTKWDLKQDAANEIYEKEAARIMDEQMARRNTLHDAIDSLSKDSKQRLDAIYKATTL